MGLDMVEIVMAIEETFGIEIPDENAEKILTQRDAVDFISRVVPMAPSGSCSTQDIFHRLRRGFRKLIPASTMKLSRQTGLKEFLTRKQWPHVWKSLRDSVGSPEWPAAVQWAGPFRYGPRTIGDLVWHIALALPQRRRQTSEPWTRGNIALEVRRVIFSVLGELDYPNRAHFVRDLGAD